MKHLVLTRTQNWSIKKTRSSLVLVKSPVSFPVVLLMQWMWGCLDNDWGKRREREDREWVAGRTRTLLYRNHNLRTHTVEPLMTEWPSDIWCDSVTSAPLANQMPLIYLPFALSSPQSFPLKLHLAPNSLVKRSFFSPFSSFSPRVVEHFLSFNCLSVTLGITAPVVLSLCRNLPVSVLCMSTPYLGD